MEAAAVMAMNKDDLEDSSQITLVDNNLAEKNNCQICHILRV